MSNAIQNRLRLLLVDGDVVDCTTTASSVGTTSLLRLQNPTSELMATGTVLTLTQKGVSDGLESDSNDLFYAGSFETNSILTFNPANGTVQTFVRDPRIAWTDTTSVSADGYLYFTENQLFRSPSM